MVGGVGVNKSLGAFTASVAPHWTAILLALICLLAFALRVTYRTFAGSDDFWRHGYGLFYALAEHVAAGKGLWNEGGAWAMRQPIYPWFLALTALGGKHYMLIVIPQALFGVGTVACAFLIARRFFSARTGLIAAGLAAVYPYYVVHDTALQDTGMATAAATLSAYLLLRARTGRSALLWILAGVVLGASVLVRATLLPFAMAAVAWIAIVGEGPLPRRLLRTGLVFAACGLIVGAWMERNYLRIGRPVLSSETGHLFWAAHNADTFRRYPTASIDDSTRQAWRDMSPREQREANSLPNELAANDWFMSRGLRYVRAHPTTTLAESALKIEAGFSWNLNPRREPFVQAFYFASYLPTLILGITGMALAWRGWREQSLIYLQFLSFITVTAIFWAHTSHRSYLDVYLIVFSASVIDRLISGPPSRLPAASSGDRHPRRRAIGLAYGPGNNSEVRPSSR